MKEKTSIAMHSPCSLRDWISHETTSYGSNAPTSLLKNCPIMSTDSVTTSLTPIHSQDVTLISSRNRSGKTIGLPLLLARMAHYNNTPLKVIHSFPNRIQEYAIYDLHKEFSQRETNYPLKVRTLDLSLTRDNGDINDNLCNSDYMSTIVLLSRFRLDQYRISHVIIDDFNAETTAEMELLWTCVQMISAGCKFKVILLNDGLSGRVRKRVDDLCLNAVSFTHIYENIGKNIVYYKGILTLEERKLKVVDHATLKSFLQIVPKEVNLGKDELITPKELSELIKNTSYIIDKLFNTDNNEEKYHKIAVHAPSPHDIDLIVDSIGFILTRYKVNVFIVHSKSHLSKCNLTRNENSILFVTGLMEDCIPLFSPNYIIDMGLYRYKIENDPIGTNQFVTIIGDRPILLRRSHRYHGRSLPTIIYPFDTKRLENITKRLIIRPAGVDLTLKHLVNSTKWMKRINDDETCTVLTKCRIQAIKCGFLSRRYPIDYDTPYYLCGSFCYTILGFLPMRLAKLILCGMVTACTDAAISLAVALHEEQVFLHYRKVSKAVSNKCKVGVDSDHLVLLHAYDTRYTVCKEWMIPSKMKQLEDLEKRIIAEIKRIPYATIKLKTDQFTDSPETEKRLLLAIGMAFGDRVGLCKRMYKKFDNTNDDGRTNHMVVNHPHNHNLPFYFESEGHHLIDSDRRGVYFKMKEYRLGSYEGINVSITHVTMLPTIVLIVIGNIGAKYTVDGKNITIDGNTGGLSIIMEKESYVKEMMNMRDDIVNEMESIAHSFLSAKKGVVVPLKNDRSVWMNHIIDRIQTHLVK